MNSPQGIDKPTTYMTLTGGEHVLIRPIKPKDAEIEKAFVHRLSPKAKYLRFMSGVNELSPEMTQYFTRVNFSRDMALIAVIQESGEEREIAVGRYYGSPNGQCELALVVDDQWQGHGIGFKIITELIKDARKKGYKTMFADMFSDNFPMIHLVRDLGFSVTLTRDDARVSRALLQIQSPPIINQ